MNLNLLLQYLIIMRKLKMKKIYQNNLMMIIMIKKTRFMIHYNLNLKIKKKKNKILNKSIFY